VIPRVLCGKDFRVQPPIPRNSPFHHAQVFSLISLPLFINLCSNLVAWAVTPANAEGFISSESIAAVANRLLISKHRGRYSGLVGASFPMTEFVIMGSKSKDPKTPGKSSQKAQ
jgi:hypothetical protein